MDTQDKLLLVERLMPQRVEQVPSTIWLDLGLLVFLGGRERTRTEHALFIYRRRL